MKRVGRVLLLLSCLAAAGCQNDNRRTLEEFAERWKVLFNSHDLPGFTELYAANGAYMTPGMVFPARSPAALHTALEQFWKNFDDSRITDIHSLVAGSDRLAFAWELELRRAKATNAQKVRGATFMTLEKGRIVQQLTITAR